LGFVVTNDPKGHDYITSVLGSQYVGLTNRLVSAPFVLGPTSPGKWGLSMFGTGATITYSFMPTGTSCAAESRCTTTTTLSSFMPLGWKSQIVASLNAWAVFANVTFTEVSDDGSAFNAAGTAGQIRFGGHAFDGPFGVLAHGYYPPANGLTAAGDIHFDVLETWKIGFGGMGFDILQVMMHEVGHALGLDHTPVPASLMNPFYSEAFLGAQADDKAGAIFIYGSVLAVIPTE
jgi:hypothetical protein